MSIQGSPTSCEIPAFSREGFGVTSGAEYEQGRRVTHTCHLSRESNVLRSKNALPHSRNRRAITFQNAAQPGPNSTKLVASHLKSGRGTSTNQVLRRRKRPDQKGTDSARKVLPSRRTGTLTGGGGAVSLGVSLRRSRLGKYRREHRSPQRGSTAWRPRSAQKRRAQAVSSCTPGPQRRSFSAGAGSRAAISA